MATPVQQANILIEGFTVLEYLEYTGLELPIILNYLLSFSIRAALHDIATIDLSACLILNNLINSGLVLLINRARPDPYTDPGQPAKEMQSIMFMVGWYAVYMFWWPALFDWLSTVSLGVVVVWAWLALQLGGHYLGSQLLGAAFVGLVLGVAWGLRYHMIVLPIAPPWVRWWNERAPRACHVTHANHYHPGTHCYDEYCDGYCVRDTSSHKLGSELGFGQLSTTLLRLLVIDLIHL
jgi:hypothetical protein